MRQKKGHPGSGAQSFNSRTPGGVRLYSSHLQAYNEEVSIHAPREGCDRRRFYTLRNEEFQFTHPGRGATDHSLTTIGQEDCFNSRTPGGVRLQRDNTQSRALGVSIHAPREGCDLLYDPRGLLSAGFNSRTPGGVRPRSHSRRLARFYVSIHAPREGCD